MCGSIVEGNGEVIERNDSLSVRYQMEQRCGSHRDNRYRYNAKEKQAFLALPYIDYGAGMYDRKMQEQRKNSISGSLIFKNRSSI